MRRVGATEVGGRILCLGALLLLCGSDSARAQAVTRSTPSQVKAAFIRNFARYVAWPKEAFPNDEAPWQICVLGSDPFGDILDRTLEGRAEQGRAFAIHRAELASELPECQIVFVGYESTERRRAALLRWKDSPVLTIGDAPDFLAEGGIIRFDVVVNVRFGINLGQARAASLKIPTKMLEVCSEILLDGTTRKQR